MGVAPEEGFEPPTQRLTAACSTTELLRNTPGGADRIRTGVHGFAGRCVATPPPRHPRETDGGPHDLRDAATIIMPPDSVNVGRHRQRAMPVHSQTINGRATGESRKPLPPLGDRVFTVVSKRAVALPARDERGH